MSTIKPTLPPRIERFVAEYLADPNATAAAVRAGYSKHTSKQQACRLLKRRDVTEALREARERMGLKRSQMLDGLAERLALSTERTLQQIANLAFFDVRRMVHDDGSPKALGELDDAEAAAVMSYEVSESWEGSGADRRKVVSTKARLVSRVSALDMAARVTGAYARDNEQRRGAREMTDEEIRLRILELMGQTKPAETPIQ